MTAVFFPDDTEQRMQLGYKRGVLVAHALEQLAGSLDVGEEESDDAVRKAIFWRSLLGVLFRFLTWSGG